MNADYKDAPAVCELALYNFDKANEETQLNCYYLFHENDSKYWGWYGDMGPYNGAYFTYNGSDFERCEYN